VFQRATTSIPQVELTTASMMASNPDPSVREECHKVVLDTVVGKDARSLYL
jgi:hypothetical protein